MSVIVHLLPANCECGFRLARLQYDIEQDIKTMLLPEIYAKYGIKRSCCKAHIQAPIAAIPNLIRDFELKPDAEAPAIRTTRTLFPVS